jgi:predicted metal-dependent enzyme (double-stranded beta helix superfamily)
MMSLLPVIDPRLAAADAVRSLVDVSHGADAAFLSVAQPTLRSQLDGADRLGPLPLAEIGKSLRRLLFPAPMSRFRIRAIDGPPVCRTPVHNHRCSCGYCSGRGSLEEIVGSVDPTGDDAVESARWRRDAGYVGGSPLDAGVMHEMLNRGADAASSIHVFAYRSRPARGVDRPMLHRRSTAEET